jgi:hypothetical protein
MSQRSRRRTTPTRRVIRKKPPKKSPPKTTIKKKAPKPQKPQTPGQIKSELAWRERMRLLELPYGTLPPPYHKTFTEYRVGKRKVPKGTKGAKRTRATYLWDTALGIRKYEVETIAPGIHTKSYPIPGPEYGQFSGLVLRAMEYMSAHSLLMRGGVEFLEMYVTGFDEHDKHRRVNISMLTERVVNWRKMPEAVAARIVEGLRRAGYRTQYPIKIFKEARTKSRTPVAVKAWNRLEVLRDAKLHIKFYAKIPE